MLSIFKPAPHQPLLPETEIDPAYRRLRLQIFIGIFAGYAAYYFVRKNFALAFPELSKQGFSHLQPGFALSAISIAYGISKFIMGSVSDRSNPRLFLPAGLVLSAVIMLIMGFFPWATSSIAIMFALLFTCGRRFRAWAGRPAGALWCIGGRIKSAAALSPYGTAPIMSAAACRLCRPCRRCDDLMTGAACFICLQSGQYGLHDSYRLSDLRAGYAYRPARA